ncbi:MAG: hypothetical protein HRT69_18575 [Flavobacteriaceae bacterium]|nr:hypothetical protein [Flavobacteriaceae bacterium]
MELQLAYIGLTFVMIFIVFKGGVYTINKTFFDVEIQKKKKGILLLVLLIWQVYILIIASSGFLMSYSFPPRFALFLIIPSFVFTGIFLYKNKNHKWIQNIPERWLIYVQTFRVPVELIFVFSVAKGILHKEVSIEGYNYDMVFAFTAPIIGLLVFKLKLLSEKWLVYWNYLGLIVLASVIFVFLTTTYVPELYGSSVPLLPLEALKYPYVLIAGFLMPLAVFIHLLSIVQLKQR